MTGSRTPKRAPAHRKAAVQARPRPAAGDCLLDGIDTVLARLTAPAGQLVDELRLALARTAARGDTCRVPDAADRVRAAAELLLAGESERARQTLRDARAGLVGGVVEAGQPSGAAPAVLGGA
jgi:hypothetical protein